MKHLALALVLGLLAAAVPLVVTSGQCPQTLAADAPRYLVLASDASAHKLRCLAGSRIAFERVRSVEAATAHLSDEHVAGVVSDPPVNVSMPPTAMHDWMAVGNGRAVFGLDLAGPDVVAGRFKTPDKLSIERGVQSLGRVYAYTTGQGYGGGGGIIEYVASSPRVVGGVMFQTAQTLLVR